MILRTQKRRDTSNNAKDTVTQQTMTRSDPRLTSGGIGPEVGVADIVMLSARLEEMKSGNRRMKDGQGKWGEQGLS